MIDFGVLKFPSLMLAVLMPAMAAFLLGGRSKYILKLLLVIAANIMIFVMVSIGYAFQTFVTTTSGLHYYVLPLMIRVQRAVVSSVTPAGYLYIIMMVSAIICVAVTLAPTRRRRATISLRSAFLCFMAFDIFMGVETNQSTPGYLFNIAFDIVGAGLLAIVLPLLLGWLPYRKIGRQDVAQEVNFSRDR